MGLISGGRCLPRTMRRGASVAQGSTSAGVTPYRETKFCGTFAVDGKDNKDARMRKSAKKFVRGHVSPSGRLSLPAEFRKAVGLERGGEVVVELDDREIRIRTLDDAIAEAQALSQRLLAGKRNASVDDFLKERRADWKEP